MVVVGAVMASPRIERARGDWLRRPTGDFGAPARDAGRFGSSETYLLSDAAFDPEGPAHRLPPIRDEGKLHLITPGGRWPSHTTDSGHRSVLRAGFALLSPDGNWIGFVSVSNRDHVWAPDQDARSAREPRQMSSRLTFFPLPVQWAPVAPGSRQQRSGLAIVSPDGPIEPHVHEQVWLAFSWAAGQPAALRIVRATTSALDIPRRSISDRHRTRFGPISCRCLWPAACAGPHARLPDTLSPRRQVRSDVWMLNGFQPPPTLWDRLVSLYRSEVADPPPPRCAGKNPGIQGSSPDPHRQGPDDSAHC